jgi:hypothetical protein
MDETEYADRMVLMQTGKYSIWDIERIKKTFF